MWSHICYSHVLLVLVYAIQDTNNNEKKNYNREETIFADVIRNISRVNYVLQELITNYEQLQKIYKSEENVEKDYSSDAEIDELFKNIKNVKKKRGRDINNSKEKSIETSYFPATQMIWSDNDEPNDDTIEQSQEKYRNKLKVNQSKTDSLSTEIKAIPVKKGEPIAEDTSDKSKEITAYKIKENPKQAEIVFIDTHNKKDATVKNEIQFAAIVKQPKTRYRKVSQKTTTRRNKKREKNNIIIKSDHLLRKDKITKNIKKIVYAEAFSPKTIWNEIIQNKPIHLKTQKEIMYSMNERKDVDNVKQNLRSVEGKPALVIPTINNKKTKEEEPSQSTEDNSISKEIFQTNVLRDAYGDACLKVVVKKCYKACKLVGKAVCARYSCKTKFKERFKKSSQTGCIKEFRGVSINNTVSLNMRGDYNDATRGGFLAVCHTHAHQNHNIKRPTLRNETQSLSTNPASKFEKELHILRDRYERACKRASAKKCISACTYASKDTCDTFICTKGLKKAYRKYCKRLCRAAYKSRGKTSSESETSSGTDSSNSDTSSGSHI